MYRLQQKSVKCQAYTKKDPDADSRQANEGTKSQLEQQADGKTKKSRNTKHSKSKPSKNQMKRI